MCFFFLTWNPKQPFISIYKWMFQLDDSKSLHRKWLEITKHPFIYKWFGPFQRIWNLKCLIFLGEIGIGKTPETLQETMSRKLARWAMKLTDAGILGLLNHCTKLQSLCVAAIAFSVRRNSWFPLIGGYIIYIIYTPLIIVLAFWGIIC